MNFEGGRPSLRPQLGSPTSAVRAAYFERLTFALTAERPGKPVNSSRVRQRSAHRLCLYLGRNSLAQAMPQTPDGAPQA
jgi:hypothetical protein